MHCSGALRLLANSVDGNYPKSSTSVELAIRDRIELDKEILPVFYPKGGTFFLQGQPARGVFLLRTGQTKESIVSYNGRTAIVRVAGPGVMLGLSAVLTGAPHESTVETLEPTHADFVRRNFFLRLLEKSPQLSHVVTSQLSNSCTEAYATIRYVSFCGSVAEKVARLLLHWAECPLSNRPGNTAGVRIRVTLTHEEIGQLVGITRESMTRSLGKLREKKWVITNGSIWTITNMEA